MKWIICLVFLFFQNLGFSQLEIKTEDWQFVKPIIWESIPSANFQPTSKGISFSLKSKLDFKEVPNSVELEKLSRTCFYNSLGHFCKIELQIEKAARIPVKFRLGEVHYTERMEKVY